MTAPNLNLETLPEVFGHTGVKWRESGDQIGFVDVFGVTWEVFRDRENRLVRQRALQGELRAVVRHFTG
jgi:hypothetical protein